MDRSAMHFDNHLHARATAEVDATREARDRLAVDGLVVLAVLSAESGGRAKADQRGADRHRAFQGMLELLDVQTGHVRRQAGDAHARIIQNATQFGGFFREILGRHVVHMIAPAARLGFGAHFIRHAAGAQFNAVIAQTFQKFALLGHGHGRQANGCHAVFHLCSYILL